MARLLLENFEHSSYDNSGWTETVGTGNIVESANTDVTGPSGNGVLKTELAGTNANAYTVYDLGSNKAVVYFTTWLRVGSDSSTSDTNDIVIASVSGVVNNVNVRLRYTPTRAWHIDLRRYSNGDGAIGDLDGNSNDNLQISTDTWYRVGFFYDGTNNVVTGYLWDADGNVLDTATENTGLNLRTDSRYVTVGTGTRTAGLELYFDAVQLDDLDWPTTPVNVSNLYDLHHINDDVTENYILIDDIDASNTDPANVADWSSQNYTEGSWVKYTDGYTYYCIQDTTSSQNPTDTDYWEQMWESEHGWEPIADYSTRFTGHFDGAFHTIDGLYMDCNLTTNYAGEYFGFIAACGDNTTIKNVGFTNVDITFRHSNGGNKAFGIVTALFASLNSGTFSSMENVWTTGTLDAESRTNNDISALVADFQGHSEIKNCYTDVAITLSSANNVHNVGHLVGRSTLLATDTLIENCYAKGSTIGNYSKTRGGGLIGYWHGCDASYRAATFRDILCLVDMTGLNGASIDPIGYPGDLTYATITDLFFDEDETNQTTAANGTALSTTEAQDIDSYTTGGVDWDMVLKSNHDGDEDTATWFIDDGVDWPQLWYEYVDSSSHNLTASDLLSGTPVLEAPALSTDGAHSLTANDLVSGTPVLGSPALSQAHTLSAKGVTSGVPVVGGGSNYLIIDHESVDEFDSLTSEQITAAKEILIIIGGESHSAAYNEGLTRLESSDPTYNATVNTSGAPTTYVDDALRLSKSYRYGSSWNTSMGEGTFWTNATAISNIKTGLDYMANNYTGVILFGLGWCWDFERNGVTVAKDPVYGCGWAGSTVGGPDGDLKWGIDDDDNTITGNSLNLQSYIDAVVEYNTYQPDVITMFTTGPVDGYNSEAGYQRYLKHRAIEQYVRDNGGVLFDYADILMWNNDGEYYESSWDGHNFGLIHPDNDGEDSGHIGYTGIDRIGKALWVLAAKISQLGVGGAPALTVNESSFSLTADPITAGDPVMSSPAIFQSQSLTSVSVVTGSPVLGTPGLSTEGSHSLEADGVVTGDPVSGTPEISQSHSIGAPVQITTGSPSVGTPAISQRSSLSANSVVSGAPVLSDPALSQNHSITPTILLSGAPDLGSPGLSTEGVHSLTAVGIIVTPDISETAITQNHGLVPTPVTAGAPAIGTPELTIGVTSVSLTATGIITGSPALEFPAITQTHDIAPVGIVTGVPDIGEAAFPGGTVQVRIWIRRS